MWLEVLLTTATLLTTSVSMETDRQCVAIAGSTGATGRALVTQLANSGHNVVALTRREDVDVAATFEGISGDHANKVTVRPVDHANKESVADAIRGCQAVISGLGTSRANDEVKEAMAQRGD